jgi:hypothetical protein
MALYPQMAATRPFILPAAALKAAATNTQPSRGPVIKLPASSEYLATFELGSRTSVKRTPYQTGSVFFWNGPTNTSGITGMWLDIARQVRGGQGGSRERRSGHPWVVERGLLADRRGHRIVSHTTAISSSPAP